MKVVKIFCALCVPFVAYCQELSQELAEEFKKLKEQQDERPQIRYEWVYPKGMLNHLPNEIFHNIASYLGPRAILNYAQTSKASKEKVEESGAFHTLNLSKKTFPNEQLIPTQRLNVIRARHQGPGLKRVDLSGQNLSGIDWSFLKNSPRIQFLYLNKGKLTQIPLEIARLEGLQQLDLSENNFSGHHINWMVFNSLTKLKALYLNIVQITDLPVELSTLKNLQGLSLCINNLSHANFAPLASLHALTQLFLNNCDLLSIPQELGSLKKLKELSLHGNNLAQASFAPLASLPLTKLTLSLCGLERLPRELSDLVSLEELNLSYNRLSRQDIDWALLNGLPKLKHIVLAGNELRQRPAALRADIRVEL